MKTLLLILAFILPNLILSQTESKESKLFRYWAQQERKKSLEDTLNKLGYYKKETSFYIQGEKLGEYQKATYYSILKSINDIVKLESDEMIKKSYYDTILQFQSKMKFKGFDDLLNNKMRLIANINSSIPNKYFTDSILLKEKLDSTQLFQDWYRIYFNNLYQIYGEKKDTTYLFRIFDEYINLTNTKNSGIEYYSSLFYNLFDTSDMILKIEPHFWRNWENDLEVNDLMYSLVISNDLKSNSIYKLMIDNLVKLNPTSTNYFRLANYYQDKGLTSEYTKTLNSIKVKFPEYVDEINYNNCVNDYNMGKYKSSYDLAIKINGEYKAKALKLAALSVINLAPNSGVSTFERKCNYYLAIDLLNRSNNLGENNSAMISNLRTFLPTNEEKFEQGNPKTQYLSTFQTTININ
jgi:hypothetical protein